jgi:amino acid adenylation domain-containing protein
MHDWRSFSETERQQELEAFLTKDRKCGFDFLKPPVMRLNLFQLDNRDSLFIWTYHHALLDGRARFILLKELSLLYHAHWVKQEPQLPVPPDFGDYVEWFWKQDRSHAEDYWRELLGTFTAPASVVLAGEAPPPHKMRTHAVEQIELSSVVKLALKSAAQAHRVTVGIIAQAVWSMLLSRYAGIEDIVFGEIRACRRPSFKQSSSIVGLLLNTVPVRLSTEGNRSPVDLFQDLRCQHVALRDYEQTELQRIRECSGVSRKEKLFDSVVVFEEHDLDFGLKEQDCSLWRSGVRVFSPSHYPLALAGYNKPDLSLSIQYDQNLFSDPAMRRMAGHFRQLLQEMLANPEMPVGNLSLLTENERCRILESGDKSECFFNSCLPRLFEQQVEQTPQAVAIHYEDRKLSYQELNSRANQLGRYLQKLQFGRGFVAAICMEPSPEMMVSLLAVLKTGGAYVPLDPSYPEKRLKLVLEDSKANILLTQRATSARLVVSDAVQVCIDTDWGAIARESTQNFRSVIELDDLFYVIYTSGSTGQPRGAGVYHRSYLNLLNWFVTDLKITGRDRVLLYSSFGFDLTQKTLYAPLIVGATLYITRNYQNPSLVLSVILQASISLLNCAPAAFYPLVEEAKKSNFEPLRSLRILTLGGEPILLPALEEWLQSEAFACQIVNTYGPTECTDIATCYHFPQREKTPAGPVPIGRTIPNVKLCVVDQHLQLLPEGVMGELCIVGLSVGLGYLHDPVLTAMKFVPDPFSAEPGKRVYRTGDIGRYRDDGLFEFICRRDYQVKIRGLRIELGEIETVLMRFPGIQRAVVLARKQDSEDLLLAYFAVDNPQTFNVQELRCFLREHLPVYMLPNALVPLKGMPLNSHGKIDRAALVDLEMNHEVQREEVAQPATDVECALAAIWSDVLKTGAIGRFDDFLELGGHSLLAMQVASRIQQTFDVELPLSAVFDHPNVAALAAEIERSSAGRPLLLASHVAQQA